MTATATITGKRQVTIPAKIFKEMGFSNGQVLVFTVNTKRKSVEIESPASLVDKLGGSLANFVPKHLRESPPTKKESRKAVGQYLGKRSRISN